MEKQAITNISADNLREYLNQWSEDEYLLVDVRQPREYEEGHIAGAFLFPLSDFSQRQDELPVKKNMVFY